MTPWGGHLLFTLNTPRLLLSCLRRLLCYAADQAQWLLIMLNARVQEVSRCPWRKREPLPLVLTASQNAWPRGMFNNTLRPWCQVQLFCERAHSRLPVSLERGGLRLGSCLPLNFEQRRLRH